MIYVSSSCVRFNKISESLRFLADNGFSHIELSGGTDYYDQLEEDLLDLKEEYGLSYLIHNYFPPPKKHFVLNLASLDNKIFEMSIDHYKNSILLAEKLGSKKIGIHAGYLINPDVKKLGRKMSISDLADKDEATSRFCEGYEMLKKSAGNISIYIENNVLAKMNFNIYKTKPFLLTNFQDYLELSDKIDFPLILDVAHLKVSCNTLGLDFINQLSKFLDITDYLHLSDNDGSLDSNQPLKQNEMLELIKRSGLQDKTITLEVYDNIEHIKSSYQLLS